jgi:hypothetical protein
MKIKNEGIYATMDNIFSFILSIAFSVILLFVAFYLGVLLNAWFVANTKKEIVILF